MNRALLLAVTVLAACPAPGAQTGGATGGTTTGHAKPPLDQDSKLVVVLVIDQLPEWSLEQKLPKLTAGGFARILGEGEWHVGHHPSAATLTAPGHTLLGTGKPPAYSGILGNEWWSREEDRVVHAVEADDTTKFLRVPGLGDALARGKTGGKAVAIALKDRAARLPLGKHGLALWYDAKTATWTGNGDSAGKTIAGPAQYVTPLHGPTTTSAPMTGPAPTAPTAAGSTAAPPATTAPTAVGSTAAPPATTAAGSTAAPPPPLPAASPPPPPVKLPAWVDKLPPIAPRITPWTPLDASKLATLSGRKDDEPGEVGEKGFGRTFPHDPATTKDPKDAIVAMPLGNEIVLETALAAIDGEKLGKDNKPDLLFVSLSAHDYIAHGWGHESWEEWDELLRLDTQLASFLDTLDKKVGPHNWSLVLTSDHGAAPLPELDDGGRISFDQLLAAANNAAAAELGPGTWVPYAHFPYVYLSKATLAQPKREIAIVIKKIEYAMRSFPGIARAGRVDTYAGNCGARTGDEKALCLTFDPQRAGEVFFMPARNWILDENDDPMATAHGSLNDYDRDVPVILMPHGHAPHTPDVQPRDQLGLEEIAPLVAAWLGVDPP